VALSPNHVIQKQPRMAGIQVLPIAKWKTKGEFRNLISSYANITAKRIHFA